MLEPSHLFLITTAETIKIHLLESPSKSSNLLK